tara:strand:- start:1593 stop:2168 length:576 start_codon:yes stop_codon:yes gene_type:complete
MSLTLSSGPGVEPLTTAEAKSHLRVDTSDDDTLIDSLILASRHFVENYTGRQLIQATWVLKRKGFVNELYLPRSPLSSVSSIQYVDEDGATQTLAASVYTVDADSNPGRVVIAYGQDWPNLRDQINNVTITFVAGYGTAVTDVPEPIRQAIRLLVAHYYETREPYIIGTSASPVPFAVESLLWQYKVPSYT